MIANSCRYKRASRHVEFIHILEPHQSFANTISNIVVIAVYSYIQHLSWDRILHALSSSSSLSTKDTRNSPWSQVWFLKVAVRTTQVWVTSMMIDSSRLMLPDSSNGMSRVILYVMASKDAHPDVHSRVRPFTWCSSNFWYAVNYPLPYRQLYVKRILDLSFGTCISAVARELKQNWLVANRPGTGNCRTP